MPTYYSIITNNGLISHANASANSVNLDLIEMAVGDSNGVYYDPDGTEIALQNELYRVSLTSTVIDENNPNQLIIEAVLDETVGPFYVREVGIFDSNGDLFAIGKFPETFKPNLPSGSGKRLYIRMILGFASSPNVSLIINNDISLDPNFSSNVNNELNNRLKISENLADLTDTNAAKANLGIVSSAEGLEGLIEIATQEEIDSKTNNSKALTAKTLAGQVDFAQINNNSSSKLVAKLPISRTGRQVMAVIMKDGNIKIWGRGSNSGNTDAGSSDHYYPITLSVDPENPPTSKFTQLTLSPYSGFALDEEGKVYSWGYNAYGHLGHGDTIDKTYAKRIEYFVTNNIQIKEIITCNEMGYNDMSSVFFITIDGHVYGCGDNIEGVLGDGTTTSRYTPIRIGALENVVQVVYTCGNGGSAYFRTDDGIGNKELYVAGYNAHGQLGVGHTSRVTLPTKISPFTDVTHIAACGGVDTSNSATYGSAILIDSGKIYTAGYGGHGQLGHGNASNLSSWTEVPNFTGIIDVGMVGSPYTTTYIINSSGEILLCGYNGYGQLGSGNTASSSVFLSPVGGDLEFQGNIKKVLLAGDRSYQDIIILDNDGQIYGCGYGYYGTLSTGDFAVYNHTLFKKAIKSKIPYEKRKCIDITSNSYYYFYSIFALYDDGTLRVAGYNDYGLQGRGSVNIHSKTYNDITF